MDEEWKVKRMQTLIEQGILMEDPDGLLWLSDKMKGLIDEFNKDEEIKDLLSKKAKDDDDFERGCWSYLYIRYVEEAPTDEIKEAVAVLVAWNESARENRLDEWSMNLRFR